MIPGQIWRRMALLMVAFMLFTGLVVAGGLATEEPELRRVDCGALLEELDDFGAWYPKSQTSVRATATVDQLAAEVILANAPELDAYRQWWQEANDTAAWPGPTDLRDRRWLLPYLDQQDC